MVVCSFAVGTFVVSIKVVGVRIATYGTGMAISGSIFPIIVILSFTAFGTPMFIFIIGFPLMLVLFFFFFPTPTDCGNSVVGFCAAKLFQISGKFSGSPFDNLLRILFPLRERLEEFWGQLHHGVEIV